MLARSPTTSWRVAHGAWQVTCDAWCVVRTAHLERHAPRVIPDAAERTGCTACRCKRRAAFAIEGNGTPDGTREAGTATKWVR